MGTGRDANCGAVVVVAVSQPLFAFATFVVYKYREPKVFGDACIPYADPLRGVMGIALTGQS